MPRYYFHLRDDTDEVLDPEGLDIPSEAVAAKALWCARDCMAGELRDGRLDLRYRIDVHDESDAIVHTLPFANAMQLFVPAYGGRQSSDATSGTPNASESAREAERRRISRELHDSTSQLLVALQLQLGELRDSRVPNVELLLGEMAEVIRDIRNSISQIGLRQSGEDQDADGGQAIVARVFHSLGPLNRSA